MTIDDILRELQWIRDRLGDQIDGDEYARLIERRDRLRQQAREAVPGSEDELREELRRLVGAWERLQRTRIDPVKQAGGGSAGGDFGFASDAVRLNHQIDAAFGRDELERRIRDLKARLRELEEG